RVARPRDRVRHYLGIQRTVARTIAKTLAGTLRWDPVRVDLERHLIGAIAGDISHEIEHATNFPHTSLDEERTDAEDLERESSNALASARETKCEVPKRSTPA
ncbi:MAG: hypothetical protein ABJE66_35815, partial [Deltaproteobacteria bacterium]